MFLRKPRQYRHHWLFSEGDEEKIIAWQNRARQRRKEEIENDWTQNRQSEDMEDMAEEGWQQDFRIDNAFGRRLSPFSRNPLRLKSKRWSIFLAVMLVWPTLILLPLLLVVIIFIVIQHLV